MIENEWNNTFSTTWSSHTWSSLQTSDYTNNSTRNTATDIAATNASTSASTLHNNAFEYPRWAETLYLSAILLTCVTALVVNTVIMLTLTFTKRLGLVRSTFTLQLTVTDFLLALTLLPVAVNGFFSPNPLLENSVSKI